MLSDEALHCLNEDSERDRMVAGRSEDEIKKLYPFLTPAGAFGKGTYKHDNTPADALSCGLGRMMALTGASSSTPTLQRID